MSIQMMSVYLKEAIRTMDTSEGTGPNFSYASTTCQGWRNTQEDVHLSLPDFEPDASLFAVFDGHNGVEVATFVAKYLPDYIRMNRKYKAGQIVDGIKEAFVLLDCCLLMKENMTELRSIRNAAHPQQPPFTPAVSTGCTAVVVLFKSGVFYVANVGDTRCVLARSGAVTLLTDDHKPENPAETERIERAGGKVQKGRINMIINISRAFGDHMLKSNLGLPIIEQMMIALPDVVVDHYNPATDQFMVLMCDGIWNSWDNEQVVEYIGKRLKENVPLRQITEEVVSQILPHDMPSSIKGKDNMTILVIKFNGQGQ